MSLRVLVAPSGFKNSLDVWAVTEAIATGIQRGMPDARVLKAPMVDGGEGFVRALVGATGGTIRRAVVTGPIGLPVDSFYGFLGGSGPKTAVIEIAAAAGLSLVPVSHRDPTRTTSFGVGELIHEALDNGAERILIGCGDSGTNDGGAGMAQALGVGLLDCDDNPIGFGGAELSRISRVDLSRRDPRLNHVGIDAAVSWQNVLLGERGVARLFGPQKGATPEQVLVLEHALGNYAYRVLAATGCAISTAPGAGASGGLGAGILALLGGRLHPRYQVIMPFLKFDELLIEADLVVTAEGALDGLTPIGKIPAEVARRAKAHGLPVVALAGTIGKGCAENFNHGIDAFAGIIKRPCSLDESIRDARRLLMHAAEDAVRMIGVGLVLGLKKSAQPRASRG
ncbi:MAG: glycerate kinase [Rhizobiales bacterium]|nr:glycerate kinase [Hyphomicrobiales bacterium]